LDEIEEMVDQAVELGIEVFEISGGEPTVLDRRFLLEVVNYASHRGLLTVLNTNGYGLTSEYASKLAVAGLGKVKLSLYGTKPYTNDDFTRFLGSFKRTIKGMKSAKNAGMEVGLHCVVTPRNLSEMLNLQDFLEPYDVDTVQLGAVVPTGRGATASEYVFSEDDRAQVIRMLERRYGELLDHRYFFTIALYPEPRAYPLDRRFCNYLVERIVVDPKGDVIPCCVLPEDLKNPLGNVKEESLTDICSPQRLRQDLTAYWLLKGHKAMREELAYRRVSHCLCCVCIKMLRAARRETLEAQI
jgi:MoaA/NifB/PqqE/SkfB family radical SAM enzyme